MSEQPLYEEKQYLGFNRLSMVRRLLLTLFCFGIHLWKVKHGLNGDLFFWLGCGIIVLSILLLFTLHIRIRVYKSYMVLTGLWTSRPVTIQLKDIRSVVRKRYSKYHLNNPVFNLKWKGIVRFYTDGEEAVEITDHSGLPYRIGSHSPGKFEQALKRLLQPA
ncbi:MAG: hypothetical protein RL213_1596 [Bacteroidota bacterium]|jgi:hypothetical protein